MTSSPASSLPQVITDHACTVCGCVCDDLQLTVQDNRLTAVQGACELVRPWFEAVARDETTAAAVRAGQALEFSAAIKAAADLVSDSRAPLIWGLARSSTPGQRAAVKLAERIGATIDTTASVCHGPSIMAIQQVGESTCTLGEVRHRADLVVFWGADPVHSHPRHLERYSGDPIGQFLPHGRADRTLVVIDSVATETSRQADVFLQIPKERDFDVIWLLRQLLKKQPVPDDASLPIPREIADKLIKVFTGCKYGVVFFGLGLARKGVGHANVEALLRLVAELNDHTRFAARRLRIPGDVSGADAVLCWQSGFPFGVNFARGYPRYNPGEYTANEILENAEADFCLLVGSESVKDLSPRAKARLQQIPTIALDYPHVVSGVQPTIRFNTAIYGIHRPGTVYRMDEVPLPLRGLIQTPLPSDDQVLDAIFAALPCGTTISPRPTETRSPR